MRSFCIALFIAGALASCSGSEPCTIDWFIENETDREVVISECAKHATPSSLECMNAQKAKDSLALRRRGHVRPEPVDFGKEE